MLKNYLLVAWRQMRRGGTFTVINVAGLALGMAACLFILLYVQDERSYDGFHANAGRLYRIVQPETAITPAPLAPALAETSAGVAAYARILPTLGDVLIKDTGDHEYYESRFYWVDSTAFDLFSFPLVQGDPSLALAQANSVVITEAVARKYFGDADPMGQTLIFDVGFEAELRVTGVLRDVPPQTHFRPDFMASMVTFDAFGMLDLSDWSRPFFHSYVLLEPGGPAEAVEATLPALVEGRTAGEAPTYRLQPIRDIHLRSKLQSELEPSGSLSYVYGLSALAALILVIACINFVNLATARSAHRGREVGMRKVLGSTRASLITQFLGEAGILTLLAFGLALPLAYLLLPAFNGLTGKSLSLALLARPSFVLFLVAMVGLVGLASGGYPALFLSRFSPVRTLKGAPIQGATVSMVRNGLVVLQFAIGIILISAVFIIDDQLRFVRAKNLGFETEQTVVVSARMYGHSMVPIPFEAMRNAFEAHPGVLRVAATGDVPGTPPRATPFLLEGLTELDAMAQTTWNLYSVDYDFLETMGVEVVAGRTFSEDNPADEGTAFILNEAALRAAREEAGTAWEAPLDKRLDRYFRTQSEWILGKRGRVIGVVRDFHYQSLHHRIEPLVLQLSRATRDHFVVRTLAGDLPQTLAHLEATWAHFLPGRPFEYYFLDAAFDAQYRAEERMADLLRLGTGLSLALACLGLFGLAAFTAERRAKEISIRKVLGASMTDIIMLLARGFSGLVLAAFIVAVPVAYLLLRRWLEAFAYRIDLGLGVFILAGLAAWALALLAVSLLSIRAARTNPAERLQYE